MLDQLDDLFYKGFLEKVEPSPLKSTLSIKEANLWLKEAEKNYNNGTYRSARVCTYLAFLHAARSVALRDGVLESRPQYLIDFLSTYASQDDLEDEWIQIFGWILNLHSKDLHEFQTTHSPEEVEMALEYGREFIQRMRQLLNETCKLPRSLIKHAINENERQNIGD